MEASIAALRFDSPTWCLLQVLPRLDSGGVERTTVDIADAVVKAGGKAVVVSEGGEMEVDLQRAGAIHERLPVASKNPLVMRTNIKRLSQVIARHEVDIVHARSRAPAWSAYYAAKRCERPFVTTFHGAYSRGVPLKQSYNAIMTKGRRVIANSEYIGRHLREVYGVERERLRVIPRGVDLLRFDPQQVSVARVIRLAEQWQLPDGVPVVMLPGRLTRWKGQHLVLEALEHLSDLDLIAAFVGGEQPGHAGYREELEQAIRDRGLIGRAQVLGHCDDMPAAYRLADVVVSASTDPEAFGRVISEAQALGRPVVAADHGGAPEQILDGHTGKLFPPGDAKALAEGIRWGLGLTPEQREILAMDALAHVRISFSKEQMCTRTLAVYAEVLGRAVTLDNRELDDHSVV
ncbi:MAG: glycosyltransferase family 4 protein [Rhodospirillales bacterium]